jgi:hypothetical protein
MQDKNENENILSSVDKTKDFWGKFKECFGSSVTGFMIHSVLSECHFLWKPKKK